MFLFFRDRAARDPSLAIVLFQVLLENLDNQYSRFLQEGNGENFVLQCSFRRFKQNFQVFPHFCSHNFFKATLSLFTASVILLSTVIVLLYCVHSDTKRSHTIWLALFSGSSPKSERFYKWLSCLTRSLSIPDIISSNLFTLIKYQHQPSSLLSSSSLRLSLC